ncbi:MAG: sulfur carrier protein ThiS [Pseudomonadota bacterium]
MRIRLNGRTWETEARTVAALLEELRAQGALDAASDTVATAVNGAFTPQADRPTQTLSEGDAVEIVSPRQGG